MRKAKIKAKTKSDKKDLVMLSADELATAAGGKCDRRIIVYSTPS